MSIVKLLKHEPQQIKDSFLEIFQVVRQYFILIYELEVDIDKEFIVGGAGEVIPIEKHSEDLEVGFEVFAKVLALELAVGQRYAGLDEI